MTSNTRSLSANEQRAELIQVDHALDSMRDAGFDLTAAVGEPLDNSIEAEATLMRVLPIYGPRKKSIQSIIISDNGLGIEPSKMHHVLSMGYSSRYGERQGLGRFGVGLKLAGLSLGERIDIYSKRTGDDRIHHSYIDLIEIREGSQQYIRTEEVAAWPENAAKLMTGRDGNLFASGTVVIFGKIDRLVSGGAYGTSLEEKVSDLRKFIARAYRTFIDSGRAFELEGKPVTLHDPLFLRDNPRIISRYKSLDPRGQLIEETDLKIDGHAVHVAVTAVPVQFRHKMGDGGEVDFNGEDIREFQINSENAAKVSILRNGREIYYDIVPRLLGDTARRDKVIRYVGIEISFPAELDEYFQVRHVKRGAEPVNRLRHELRDWLKRPVEQAGKVIRSHWGEVDARDRLNNGEHVGSMETAQRTNPAFPKGLAGRAATPEQEEQVVQDAAEDMGLDLEADATKIENLREQVRTKPITLLDGRWPGKEFLEIHHLNGKSVVKLNHRHAFFRDVYGPLKKIADQGAEGMSPEDIVDLVRKAEEAIDLLFMAYARAESMYEDPGQFDDLRTYWGMFTEALLKEQFKDQ
ncbi:ATP-binding protein [Streptomyces sp. ADMS]|uniref:ATP-binding protein n=1 Tax=Streptomyces sp. ADMS TaxID=3071415 RepID=UPI00296E4FF8|nr:ATP-binding protein [Streptomyces sp. ADMS]MDW4909426.1 ATP-binding protein [Streptomyces sp. ADMS]